MTDVRAMIAEAKRQRRQPPAYLNKRDKLLWRLGWYDGWFVLKGALARRYPFRWLWIARTAWLLFTKWNAPRDDPYHHMTLVENWHYASSLAQMMDEAGEGYLSPSDAIDEDRYYWSD